MFRFANIDPLLRFSQYKKLCDDDEEDIWKQHDEKKTMEMEAKPEKEAYVYGFNMCHVCRKEGGFACKGCQDTPALPFDSHLNQTQSLTYYCSHKCQKADWEAHKKGCAQQRARRTLFRAGQVLQDIYFAYRKKTFDKYVVDVGVEDCKLYIQEGDYRKIPKFDEPCVFPFPEELCKDRKVREGVLAALTGVDPNVAMHELIGFLLNDIAKICEITVSMTEQPIPTTLLTSHGHPAAVDTLIPHGVTHVKLKAAPREWYVLDLTAAQFGFFDTVVEFDVFEPRVSHPDAILDFGTLAKDTEKFMNDGKEYGFLSLGFKLEVSKCLLPAVKEWLAKEVLSHSHFLSLKLDKFEAKKTELVDHVTKVLDAKFLTLEYEEMRAYVCRCRQGKNNRAARDDVSDTGTVTWRGNDGSG